MAEEGYYDLGSFHRAIDTSSEAAQRWFDRGLVWCYGFNHEEAAKCFERAADCDEACTMAYWGLAYALGPNYNKPWELFGRAEREFATRRAHEAAIRAGRCADSDVEQALAAALMHRYPRAEPSPTRTEAADWNRDYAEAMVGVAVLFPDDLDVAALCVDALINLTPWGLWDIRSGQPATGARTVEARRLLERALGQPRGDRHPGLLHLHIHLMEMSPTPEAALPAADALRRLVPDSGHLNHMPSHVDMLVGDYVSAVAANSSAIRADDAFLRREGPLNFYTLYRSHDYHFRLYAAMFAAQSRVAFETVDLLEASVSERLLRVESPPMADWLEAFLAMRVHALIRFGRWHDVLALEPPADTELYCVTVALLHYARGVALAALGRVDEARDQRRLFRDAVPRVKPSRTLFNNKCVDILCVADAMLDGEIEYRAGQHERAFQRLREAMNLYDGLPFDEPWGWMQPVRHAYGALLLEQDRVADALAVYRADLGLDDSLPRVHQHRNNVWALHGYHECLQRLGRSVEAAEVEPRLREAQARADVPVRSSCYCRGSECRM
ncbi:TPR domain protein [Ophiocordyceps camponoti-floridani]|uniref:TPR domain protein n=1 Tax=Ophiocordyceps camponoti-floridani TaxID=2030778 RepID=A0A8H4Q5S1_9HYPO|nr:TPR domain protein [Ophiocordyceps camponoti-floridani]